MIVTDEYVYACAADGTEVVMHNTGPTIVDAVREVWVEDVYRVNTLHLAGDVVDIGAHQGAFVLRALARGADRVLAVEPDAANVTWLQRNLLLNGEMTTVELNAAADRVVIVHGAAGPVSGSGRATLMPGTDMVTVQMVSDGGDIQVVALRHLVEALGNGGVRLLKMDIEGGEYVTVTADCGLDTVQRIVMETHAAPPGVLGRLVETLLDTHNLDVFGHPANGGMLYGDRY
jgi:FkbM family methyltransferase